MTSFLLMHCVCGTANKLYIKNEFLDHLINMRSQIFFVIDKLISQEFTVIYQESETNDTNSKNSSFSSTHNQFLFE